VPLNSMNSREDRSAGNLLVNACEKPNITFIQDLKKKVGPKRYKKISRKSAITGKRSKKKLKKRNSDTKNIDPGNPRNIKLLTKVIKKSLGHMKFKPLISVINRVLNRLAIASTSKKEFVESNA
jgi:hypothetical protein